MVFRVNEKGEEKTPPPKSWAVKGVEEQVGFCVGSTLVLRENFGSHGRSQVLEDGNKVLPKQALNLRTGHLLCCCEGEGNRWR